MERRNVSLLGIDSQALNTDSPDGLCEVIQNLKPKGRTDKPYWSVFETINSLSNDSQTTFTYTHGIEYVKSLFWQLRNTINENFKTSSSTSLKRLLVLCEKSGRCAIDIIDSSDWSIVKTLDLPDAVGYEFTATRVKEITIINVTKDDVPYRLYYLIDDTFIEYGWPDMPSVSFEQNEQTFTQEEVDSGTAYGVRRNSEKHYAIRWAFRLYDGTYVKHSVPQLVKVEDDSANSLKFMVPKFTLSGTIEQLTELEFWKAQIAGIGFFATVVADSELDALNQANYYELGFIPSPSRIPPDQWPGGEDPNIIEIQLSTEQWPVQDTLNIDSFTHHKRAGRVIDSYNQRLLIGGASIDFALPNNEITLTGGSGSSAATLAEYAALDLNNYSQNSQDYDGQGNPVGSGTYTINTITGRKEFTCAAAGKEFKSVFIDAQHNPNPAQQDISPDGSTLPSIEYQAVINGGELQLEIVYNSSPDYGYEETIANITMSITVYLGPQGTGVKDVDTTLTLDATLGDSAANNALVIANVMANSNSVGNQGFYEIVEIKVDDQSFYRTRFYEFSGAGDTYNVERLITYPDRRAVNYKLIVLNGSNWEIAIDRAFIQHPSMNYSYIYLYPSATSYTLGSGVTTTEPTLDANSADSYIRNQVWASLASQPLVFDAAMSYRVGQRSNEKIQGFGVNSLDVSSGQFGQYPLYVFTESAIYSLEQTGSVETAFGRIVAKSITNGLVNPQAICNAKSIVIAADSTEIYSLTGGAVERIDRPISQDPEYKQFLQDISLVYHVADDYEELICSNPNFNYTWHYNTRYGLWYKGTEGYRLFYQEEDDILGITINNDLHDFSDKDTSKNKAWSLKTRQINFGEHNFFKRLKRSAVRGKFTQSNQPDPNDYNEIRLIVEGYFEEDIPIKIFDATYKHEVLKDILFRNNFGSFNGFVITLSGINMPDQTHFREFELMFDLRYTNKVRI